MDYHITVQGEQKGPYSLSQIQSMWESGTITSDSLYWNTEAEEWKPIKELVEAPPPVLEEQPESGDEDWHLSNIALPVVNEPPPPVINQPIPPVINAPIPPEPKKPFWPSCGAGFVILIVLAVIFFQECAPTMEDIRAEIKVDIEGRLSSLSNSGIQVTKFELVHDGGHRYVGNGEFMFREMEGSFTMKVSLYDYPKYRTIVFITHPYKPEVTKIFRNFF